MDATTNRKAFLDMIAVAEGTAGLGDDGYNIIVSGIAFNDYADHPRQKIFLPRYGISSTAAGRYQILERYFDAYKKLLNLPDFSPTSQDAIALQMIKERRACEDIDAGRLNVAIIKCAPIWASLPGAGYGQREQSFKTLRCAFVKAGGVLDRDENVA
jgi:muramidase (phage lysozyme)